MAKKYFVVAEGNEHVVMKHVKVAEAYDGLKEVERHGDAEAAADAAERLNQSFEELAGVYCEKVTAFQLKGESQ